MKKELWIPALAALVITFLILGFGVFRQTKDEAETQAALPTPEAEFAATPEVVLPSEEPEIEESAPTMVPEPKAIEDDGIEIPEGMTDEEYEGLLEVLDDMSRKDKSFSLAEYSGWRAEDLAALMSRIGQYARTTGLSYEQLRGVLFARDALDAASAKEYALLLKTCYEQNAVDFIRAWHETGEPRWLMYEVTGVSDPDSCYTWLYEKWEIWCNIPDSDPEP